MKQSPDLATASRSFEAALLAGGTCGYAVCATPRQYDRLPESVATTYAEIGEANSYYVFETEAEANRRLALIQSEERLGLHLSVRPVSCFATTGALIGPKLDGRGHPFAMRGFVVDRSGATKEWTHVEKLGWSFPLRAAGSGAAEVAGPTGPGLLTRLAAWLRKHLS